MPAGNAGDDSTIDQFKYNSTSQNHEWGYGGAVATLAVTGMPGDIDTSRFAMLNNGSGYRFFYLSQS